MSVTLQTMSVQRSTTRFNQYTKPGNACQPKQVIQITHAMLTQGHAFATVSDKGNFQNLE